ncbi:MAG: STAS/SEC14 domain-containing protein [Methyloprofundus sp.]|nr:STAS/SEC14 domain-containing protein [Methyloprofundus sp.]
MLEMLDIEAEQAVAYRLTGKITEDEMKQALAAIKRKIERYGKVSLYQEIDSFTGVEFDAMVEKFKFLYANGITNFDKVAVVTDKQWLHKIVELEDKIFKNIDMQCFSLNDRKLAVEFLKEVE